MRLYRGIGCCIVAATLLTLAQGALDPNQDSRLNQRLSLRVPATPLKEIAADLSRRTGVALSVQPELGEYRAFARLQERPLHEIMQLLAAAFDFEWRAERAGGQWRYVLTQSREARTQEQLELAIAQRNLLQILREALELIPAELTESPDRRAYSRTYAELSAQKILQQPTRQGESPKSSSDFYREMVLHLRHKLLQSASAHSTGWFTLKLLANLSSEDWGRLQQQRVLALPLDTLPSAWLAEWQRGVREEGIPQEDGWHYTGQLPSTNPEPTDADLLSRSIAMRGRIVEAIQDNLRAIVGVGEFYPLAITDHWVYFSLNSARSLLMKCADTVYTVREEASALVFAARERALARATDQNYLWLRWYARLPEPLKQRLRQGETIPLGELDAGLREGLRDALRCRDLLPACAEPPELDGATAVISLRVSSQSALRGVQGQPSPQQVQYRNYQMDIRDARGLRQTLFVELPVASSSP